MKAQRPGFGAEIADAILARDGLRCGMEGARGCPGTRRAASDPGHRLNRQAGGDPRALVNSPANGNAQHHACNFGLEHDADFAEEGRRRGVKLDHGGDDLATIRDTPMWSPFYGQWTRLDEAGMHLLGITDPSLDAREWRTWPTEVLA